MSLNLTLTALKNHLEYSNNIYTTKKLFLIYFYISMSLSYLVIYPNLNIILSTKNNKEIKIKGLVRHKYAFISGPLIGPTRPTFDRSRYN